MLPGFQSGALCPRAHSPCVFTRGQGNMQSQPCLALLKALQQTECPKREVGDKRAKPLTPSQVNPIPLRIKAYAARAKEQE